MSDFELSSYQKNIMNFVSTQRGNLLVDAKAGSGKTSTLILIADELTRSGNKCLFLAFNKHIVEELQTKITNPDCLIKTVHSLGYSFIASYLYKKHGKDNYELEVDTSKLRTLVRDYYEQNFKKRLDLYNATGSTDEDFITSDMINEEMMSEQEMKDLHNNIISDFVGLCNFSRLYNINYKDKDHPDNMRKLVKKFCWYLYPYIDDVLEDYQDLVIAVIDKTKELFENPEKDLTGKPHYKIDYTDMLYFPVLYNMQVPYKIKEFTQTNLIDECLPEDTYIETQQGKSLFKEIKHKVDKGETVLVKSFNENTETFEFKPVINVVNKGNKDVFEITTNGLNKIQATANHPFLTQNGWKRLDELIIGKDYLYLDKPDNQKTKYILNDDQLQVIYASSIGDGNLEKGVYPYEYRIKFIQGDKQYNYFKFKKDLLRCDFEYKGESGYTNKKSINNTISKRFILPVNTRLEIINNLDARGLAILYMDDGSKLQNSNTYGVRISCNNLTLEETNCLINKFNEYSIEVKNVPNRGYNELRFNSKNAEKFFKLIASYMHRDCFYKNPYSTGEYKWNNNFKSFGGNIVKDIVKIGVKPVLDMEVADNHNFCVSKTNLKSGSSIVVHNCQDLSILQQKFIRKLDTNFNRFIFVGDKKQSIYAFAGADVHALEKLNDVFILQQLPLNICYRCPENVIRLAQELVPEIEWNKERPDKGEVKFLTMEKTIEQIKPEDVLIGRKNRDLVKIYRKFVLELKKPVKFRNKELVANLVNNIDQVMTDYVKLYTKGMNIRKPLDEHMAKWIADTQQQKGTDLYNQEVQAYAKKLISDNSGKSSRKNRSNTNINFLETCMKEYKELGDFGVEEDDPLTEFYDIVEDFLAEFRKVMSSVLIEDFKKYIKDFLSGSMYDTVPIISSVHSMKGGEADNVYIFDYPLFPYQMGTMTDDDYQQEKNLKYVAITRAKKNLYLILCDENDPKRSEKNIEANAEAQSLVSQLLNS